MPVHLYLHVPFCGRRCSYCDFAIAVRRETPSARYADRVLAEWQGWRTDPQFERVVKLSTVYFGGGTPSRLAPESLSHILDTILAAWPLTAGAEVTLEANPEDVTIETARAWRLAGITRVSLGVQSFHPAVLSWMHRTHGAAQAGHAVSALREAGILEVSIDLIYGLPSELRRDWARDLDLALALEPEHLSLYGLTVEEHTPLGRWVARGVAHPSPDETQAREFLLAHDRLESAGYRHYEVSNYARPGHEAVHNSAYWARATYLGLGPSAHSAHGARRWWNLREWEEWSRVVAAGRPAVAGEETLDPAAVQMEEIYLGLRTDRGIDPALIGEDLARTWEGEGWAERAGGRVRLTPDGWLRLDALAVSGAG